jgi:hypothetical protein
MFEPYTGRLTLPPLLFLDTCLRNLLPLSHCHTAVVVGDTPRP